MAFLLGPVEPMPVSAPKTTFIYCLTDPGSRIPRYFGKADDPQDRYRRHLIDRKKLRHLYCARWVKGLKKAGKRPDLHVLCEVPQDDFSRFEKAFIILGKQCGFPLTNLSDGGEGVSGRTNSPETRAKISAAKKGFKLSPSHYAAFTGAWRGKKQSAEHISRRVKRGAEHHGFGKPLSLEHRAKLRETSPLRGKKLSPEVCCSRRKKRPRASSKYLGVYWSKHVEKWVARIKHGGNSFQHIGVFTNEKDAAIAYDAAAKLHLGQFAKFNF